MATISLTLVVNSPASTAVTFAPATEFTLSGTTITASGPIASGTTVGAFTVEPANWQGVLALGGTNAADFTLNGMTLVTAAALADGSYAFEATATP